MEEEESLRRRGNSGINGETKREGKTPKWGEERGEEGE